MIGDESHTAVSPTATGSPPTACSNRKAVELRPGAVCCCVTGSWEPGDSWHAWLMKCVRAADPMRRDQLQGVDPEANARRSVRRFCPISQRLWMLPDIRALPRMTLPPRRNRHGHRHPVVKGAALDHLEGESCRLPGRSAAPLRAYLDPCGEKTRAAEASRHTTRDFLRQ